MNSPSGRSHHQRPVCEFGSFGRREVLRAGVLTMTGVGLHHLCLGNNLYAAESVAPSRAIRNCILIWLDGGPSHLETWDLKPQAPAEVRGPLSAISTNVPGMQISECFPRMAEQMHHVAIIRSMTSPLGEHNLGAHYLLTGNQPTQVLEYPSFHAAASHQMEVPGNSRQATLLPNNIAIPDYSVGGSGFSGHGFLSTAFAPFQIGGDPLSATFQVRDLSLFPGLSLDRLSRRQQLVQRIAELDEGLSSDFGTSTDPRTSTDPNIDQAFRMVTSSAAREAFDLHAESATVRQRYGMKTIGQSCLLARRLVERGVPFVTVNQRGWDTHAQLDLQLRHGYTGAAQPVGLIPSLDMALSALLSDLQQSGLLQQTLVVVMGEFGRTPKINAAAGRDHWPRVFSVALAGGGIQGGQVIGASDRTGESPADRPVTPADLVCTIYQLLGLNPETELLTSDGRPVRLVPDHAQVIAELLT